MKNFKIISALSLGAALLLTGCTDPATSAPAPSTSTAPVEKVVDPKDLSSEGIDFNTLTPEDIKPNIKQDFEFISSHGAKGSLEFVTGKDPRVAKIEKFRKASGGFHTEYLIAEVDNREGTEVANMLQVDIYDPEGLSYTYRKASDLISEWRPYTPDGDTYMKAGGTEKLTDDEYTKLEKQAVALDEELTWAIDPLEKSTFILAMPIEAKGMPTELTGVSVSAHGMFDTVSAYNPLASEWKEWNAHKQAAEESK